MWSMANVFNGMRVSYSPYMDIYFDHIKKGMTMNGTRDKGPNSKVQWNGEVYKVEAINWTLGLKPKTFLKTETNQSKTYKDSQIVWIQKTRHYKWRPLDNCVSMILHRI